MVGEKFLSAWALRGRKKKRNMHTLCIWRKSEGGKEEKFVIQLLFSVAEGKKGKKEEKGKSLTLRDEYCYNSHVYAH